uniref:Uncharacterized protein n=1 Tax=Arundo donax TaxID=35708 RepID=A0A0A9FB33_ARUDO
MLYGFKKWQKTRYVCTAHVLLKFHLIQRLMAPKMWLWCRLGVRHKRLGAVRGVKRHKNVAEGGQILMKEKETLI